MNTSNEAAIAHSESGTTVKSLPTKRYIRVLRLPQVLQITGLGKTKLYQLQGAGDFPMRICLTEHTVGWVEQEVQEWLARRIERSRPLTE